MNAPHTPLDSLLYLDARSSVLDWIAEEVGGVNTDTPDLELCADLINSFVSLIQSELNVHGGRRSHYSTGNPVYVMRPHRQIEPDPDGRFDRLVWTEWKHACTPGGTVLGDHDADD